MKSPQIVALLDLSKIGMMMFVIFLVTLGAISFRVHLYVCVPEKPGNAMNRVSVCSNEASQSPVPEEIIRLPGPGMGIAGKESRGEEIRRALFLLSLQSKILLKDDPEFPRLDASFKYYRELSKEKGETVFAAVCLTGIPRAAALTYHNQKTSFYDNMDSYTSFVYAAADMHFYEIFLYRPTVISIQPQDKLNLTVKAHFSKSEDRLQGWIQQLYALYECNEMRKRYEQKNNVQFTWLVRARFDLWFKRPLVNLESLTTEHVHLPAKYGGENGYNDRFAFIPRKHMDVYTGQFLEIEWFRGKLSPEVYLRSHLEKQGITVEQHPEWDIALMREHGQLSFM